MKALSLIGLCLAVLLVALVLWIRLAPFDSAAWHVDPDSVKKTAKPNQYLLSASADADGAAVVLPDRPEDVLKNINDFLQTAGQIAKILAASEDGLFVSFIVRTPVMRYPDILSIKLTPEGGGTRLAVYSRSRFGIRDFSVNETRVKAMLAHLNAD
ncbi:MAG: DUF1499 domain-containing protein [Pseudomonadota bacterium]